MIQDQPSRHIHIDRTIDQTIDRTILGQIIALTIRDILIIVLITLDQTIVPTTPDIQSIDQINATTFHNDIKQRSVMARNYHVKLKTITNAPHGDAKMASHCQAMLGYPAVIW